GGGRAMGSSTGCRAPRQRRAPRRPARRVAGRGPRARAPRRGLALRASRAAAAAGDPRAPGRARSGAQAARRAPHALARDPRAARGARREPSLAALGHPLCRELVARGPGRHRAPRGFVAPWPALIAADTRGILRNHPLTLPLTRAIEEAAR